MLPSLFGSNCVRSGHDLCNRSVEAGRGGANVRRVGNGGLRLILVILVFCPLNLYKGRFGIPVAGIAVRVRRSRNFPAGSVKVVMGVGIKI